MYNDSGADFVVYIQSFLVLCIKLWTKTSEIKRHEVGGEICISSAYLDDSQGWISRLENSRRAEVTPAPRRSRFGRQCAPLRRIKLFLIFFFLPSSHTTLSIPHKFSFFSVRWNPQKKTKTNKYSNLTNQLILQFHY